MLILGSQSKARYQLLRLYNAEITVKTADIDETFLNDLSIKENVEKLAYRKAMKILEGFELNDDVLICADTVVIVNEECLNKPLNYNDAYRMIRSLSSNTISVLSGVYIKFLDKEYNFSVESKIHFQEITDDIVKKYLEENHNYLQISGALDIDKIKNYIDYTFEGSYSNIIGLPMEKISAILYDGSVLEHSDFSTPKIPSINIYRSSVRSIVKEGEKIILLKGYTFDKKHYYYTTIGGGYHIFEDKEAVLKKETIEEGGLIIDELKEIYTVEEYTTLSRYIDYNKLTLHTYYLSKVKGYTECCYVEYETELIIGIERFTIEEAYNILKRQLTFFNDKQYPISVITLSDLKAIESLITI